MMMLCKNVKHDEFNEYLRHLNARWFEPSSFRIHQGDTEYWIQDHMVKAYRIKVPLNKNYNATTDSYLYYIWVENHELI